MHELTTWPTLNQHTLTLLDNLATFPTWPTTPIIFHSTTWTQTPPHRAATRTPSGLRRSVNRERRTYHRHASAYQRTIMYALHVCNFLLKKYVINFHVFYFFNTRNLGGGNVLLLSPLPYVRTNLLGRMTL